ncbi:MAG: DMT family transporter [Bacteroidetes bacterium]|nr:DMT family transporter [Bacteroidota bacterium]
MASETSPRTKAFIALHVAVFLWGFTAILGKLISYGSITLVWHRMMLTAIIYLLMPAVWKSLKGLSLKTAMTFFGVVLGILFIYFSLPENQPGHVAKVGDVSYGWAVITGLLSAALAATFTTLNKAHIHRAKSLAISTLEMISGALVLSLIIPLISSDPIVFVPPIDFSILTLKNIATGPWDLIWILLLAVLCTNLTFYLGTYALNQLSAFTANLTVNLEPIYGIVLGAVIFNENKDLNIWFYTGTSVILGAIFTQAYLSSKKN